MNVARLARPVYRPLLCMASEGERIVLGTGIMMNILAVELSMSLTITTVAAVVPTMSVNMTKRGCSHALSFHQTEHARAQQGSTLSPLQEKAP